MTDTQTQFIEVTRLRIGMFVFLDMGWMDHPFPVNNFQIRTQEQISIIRSLGLERLRYSPEKSSAEAGNPNAAAANAVTASDSPAPARSESPKATEARLRREMLASQHTSLLACERQFGLATQTFKQVTEFVHTQPLFAKEQTQTLIQGFLAGVLGEEEAAIRLLSEKAGEKTSLHSLNVTVVSLLLGKALQLSKPQMLDLGMGALLHDIGKMELPDRLRWQDEQYSIAEKQLYQSHVLHGLNMGRRMELSPGTLLLIAQHHEHCDGSGYPSGIRGEKMSPLSCIVALANRYDNLCNPGNPAMAVTPHEALSQVFTQFKAQFDVPTMTAFIRMMGVYPPGSVVQLTDERYALVVAMNSARPIKPKVVIHNPEIPREDALVINLEQEPNLGIRRSMKPLQLPKAAYDYLSPRKRLCYFFERGMELPVSGAVS
ncbi:HD-GYP domain-containing protein [Undibacterium sp. Ren11W]|uniref:HD-GYP domain-containing protein n=1 Tax=Undibacterium sp. Ren11W TaxID=3413045 RepID=UPI003BEFB990